MTSIRTQSERPSAEAPEPETPAKRPLTPQAERALAEAAARCAQRTGAADDQPREIGGRGGTDPARYGDWEVNGIASDF